VIDDRVIQCRKCGGWYGEDFFERAFGKCTYQKLRRSVCIGCRQTARDNEKMRGNRYAVKARNALISHGHKFVRKGVIRCGDELGSRFGWDLRRMAHDIEHAFKNGCSYCAVSYADMPNGLADLTLDIIDPAQPPYYATNTKWCCQTCNRSKAKTTPIRWAKKLLWWVEWRKRQSALALNPNLDTLFPADIGSIIFA
jgi:hypothetical protein